MMSIAQFCHRLEAHGGDLSRWPPDYRDAGERLLAVDAAARTAHAAAVKFDALIVRSRATRDARGPADDPAARRVLARLEAQLPRQYRGLMPRWWPAALLEFDFAPAWPRFAALVGVAVLGFALGLSNVGIALTKRPVSAMIGTNGIDSDLSMIVFEPDPLSAMRP